MTPPKKVYESKTIWLAGLLLALEPILESFPELKQSMGDNYGAWFVALSVAVGALRLLTDSPVLLRWFKR